MEIGNSARAAAATLTIELNTIKCGSIQIQVNWITMRHGVKARNILAS